MGRGEVIGTSLPGCGSGDETMSGRVPVSKWLFIDTLRAVMWSGAVTFLAKLSRL